MVRRTADERAGFGGLDSGILFVVLRFGWVHLGAWVAFTALSHRGGARQPSGSVKGCINEVCEESKT